MSITVLELTRLPHLQLALVAGESGLQREVTWAHTSDLPNPWEWLGPGELLITNGMGLGSAAPAQVAYLDRLHDIGTSGLIVGLGTSACTITARLSARADELGLSLLTIPYSVPFTAVVRAVAQANDREESNQLGKVARLYDLLRSSLAAEQAGPELFRTLGGELGVRLYLVDPETGLSLFPDQDETAFGDALVTAYAEHGGAIPGLLRLSHTNTGHDEVGAVAVAVPGAQPTALVVEPLGTEFPSALILQHLAIGGALELAQLVATQDRRRRIGADLLTQLMDGRHDPQVVSLQLEEAGIVLANCVLATARATPVMSEASVHARLVRTRVSHLLGQRNGVLFILLPESAIFPLLLPLMTAAGASVGLAGDLAGTHRVTEAAREALWTLGIAEAERRPMAWYGQPTDLVLPRTPLEANAVVERILGPLVAHDAAHGTNYVETLRVTLDHDRSWQSAASALHIHRQTLGYRLRRIEQITGRGTTRTEHLAEWWFALRARELLASPTDVAQVTDRKRATTTLPR
jgi:purine catabolism regulator